MSTAKKTLVIDFREKTHTVAWYPGASDAAVERAVRQALDVPAEAPLLLEDAEGDILTISDSLPSGLRVRGRLGGATAKTHAPCRGPSPAPGLTPSSATSPTCSVARAPSRPS